MPGAAARHAFAEFSRWVADERFLRLAAGPVASRARARPPLPLARDRRAARPLRRRARSCCTRARRCSPTPAGSPSCPRHPSPRTCSRSSSVAARRELRMWRPALRSSRWSSMTRSPRSSADRGATCARSAGGWTIATPACSRRRSRSSTGTSRRRFSPRTGAPTVATQSGWVRIDPDTGAENFPRTDPAVIVAVTDADDRLLLGSNALWEAHRFSLLAGFVEPGESLEAAVIREVFEEAGIVVDRPGLSGQPAVAVPRLAHGRLPRDGRRGRGGRRRTPDGEEILELRWFTRERARRLPRRGAAARAQLDRPRDHRGLVRRTTGRADGRRRG